MVDIRAPGANTAGTEASEPGTRDVGDTLLEFIAAHTLALASRFLGICLVSSQMRGECSRARVSKPHTGRNPAGVAVPLIA